MGALKFTCEAAVLSKALRDVRGVVKKRATMAILNNVLIEAEDGIVRLTATDLDLTAIRTIAATVETAGATTVDAGKLTDIAGALMPGAQAQLEEIDEGSRLLLTSGRSKLRFATIAAASFPKPTWIEPTASITDSAKALLRPFDTVRHAASNTIATPWLCGVFVRPNIKKKVLEFYAADTFAGRAAECVMKMPVGATVLPATIMSNAFVSALCSALADHDGDVTLDFVGPYVRADFGQLVIAAKPIEGEYPDVAKLCATEQKQTFLVDADDLGGALRRIEFMRTDKDGALRLTVAPEWLTVTGSAIGTGEEGVERLPCDFQGDEFPIAFRANLLRDALGALRCDTVEFALTETFGAPVRLRSAANPDATLVVMPFRL
jgi:DNA polymerase-3 subunit beta